ncbi:hypothetical protein FHR32_005117 [Streptosporangium album]|uniref:Uncharacterized protein n=1 Tax=Streptosporangium album TaxID=47479 RepID=A0A7W7WBX0_9ACTN|nr:hypothetical protein [Streptosporangium album]MBB4940740.1 hypothetical protein [Streptosporangium album]
MANLMIPLERINAEARTLDPAKTLVLLARLVGTVLLAIPYALGWTLRKAWMGVALLWTAAVVGWQEAGRSRQAVPDE